MTSVADTALIDRVAAIARQAGNAILAVYGRADFGTSAKADDSPLTEADLAAHEIITRSLSALTPDVPVLSEESAQIPFATRRTWSRFWLVDPLDGTKEFIKRNGEFTVNIALIDAGMPVLGFVFAPVLETLYYGGQGLGAFKEAKGRTAEIRAVDYGAGTLRVVASKSHNSEEVVRFLAQVPDNECVSMGSSLKLCLVAEGAAHLYPRLGPTMEWDTAAAQAVVEAAGGRVTDLAGAPLRYNKPDLHNPHFVVSGGPSFPWQRYLS